MKPESVRLPTLRSGIFQIWTRNFYLFRKHLLLNFFWIVLEPLLLLLAVGYGIGSFISNIQGISYADFFFPSLLCSSAMFVSFFESTYGNFAKLTYQHTYSTMILTPLDPRQIVMGEIFWAGTKGTFSAVAVSLIAGIFGHLDSFMFLPALAVIFLSSLLFGALGLWMTSMAKSYDSIIYPTSGLIVPMSLFSGTYFPLDQLPFGLKYLAYVFPLTHSVRLVRGFLIGSLPWWQTLIHLAVLGGLIFIFVRLAIEKISAKLIN